MPTKNVSRFLLALLSSAALGSGETAVVAGMNRFAVASYQKLARGQGNLIFSPFNIASSLSMALAGARGDTAAGMAKALQQVYPDAAYNTGLAALGEELAKAGNAGGNQLLTANNLWVQAGLPLLPEFRRTMEDIFRAPFTPVDFRGAGEAARRQINGWTEEHTRNRIQNLFGPDSLTPDTRMVLTSAIYFLGKWESAFRPANTHPDAFKLDGGGSVQAPLMNQTATFGYRETPAVQILEMRYGGTPLAFDILLPPQQIGLEGLERSLTPENVAAWLQPLETRPVEVYVPKFRAESDLALRKPLSEMGMAEAFSPSADFSGIDDRRDLCLSAVVHKAFVEVDEIGTEAAAATGTMVAMVAMVQRPKPAVFRADHPFVFLIRDSRSGLILFAGRLVRP
ncbi:MAG TPA: serpin family protein [Bryobacteraceae bacterium]|nr:serpin family protein [Bryobacteraceae bacterium]